MSATTGDKALKPDDTQYVCHTCIGDKVLSKQVENEEEPSEVQLLPFGESNSNAVGLVQPHSSSARRPFRTSLSASRIAR